MENTTFSLQEEVKFPDWARSFQQMKLIDMIAGCNDKSLFAQICVDQVHDKPKDVIQMIKEQALDNRVMVVEMFGKDVVTIIEQL